MATLTRARFNFLSVLVALAAVYTVMIDLCEDRPRCSVLASPDTFTQDPCAGTSKYLEAHYKCRPNDTKEQTACEGEDLDIRCGRGQRILVNYARFGRTPEGHERCPPIKRGYVNCSDMGAVNQVKVECQQRRSCSIQVTTGVFGNPCASDVSKFLTVSYSCVPKSVLNKLARKENRRRKKGKKKDKNKRKRKKKKKQQGGLDSEVEVTTSDPQEVSTEESRDDAKDQSADLINQMTESTSVTQTSLLDPDSLLEETVTGEDSDPDDVTEVARPPAEAASRTPDITLGPLEARESPVEVHTQPSLQPWDKDDMTVPTTVRPGEPDSSTEEGGGPGGVTEEVSSPGDDVTDGVIGGDYVTDDVIGGVTERDGSDRGRTLGEVSVTEDGNGREKWGVSERDQPGDALSTEGTVDEVVETSESFVSAENTEESNSRDPIGKDRPWGAKTVTSDPRSARGQGHNLRGQSDPPNSIPREMTTADPADHRGNVKDADKQHNDDASSSTTNSRPVANPEKPEAASKSKGEHSNQDGGGSQYVTERNLTILCVNFTGSGNRKDDGVNWATVRRPRDERTIGFLKDWFTVIHYLDENEEKAWLYFTLGICFGIIFMLVVVLVKVCFNFRRNIRARLDVTDPTHRSAHINNHNNGPDPLDAPMLEHSDSIDRIEVVRFSPRSTLRSMRGGARENRDLVNYYG